MEHICQSCAMPLKTKADRGTNADGSLHDDYCVFCYKNGSFTNAMPLEQFIELQVALATEKLGMPEAEARAMAERVLPTLKRWKKRSCCCCGCD